MLNQKWVNKLVSFSLCLSLLTGQALGGVSLNPVFINGREFAAAHRIPLHLPQSLGSSIEFVPGKSGKVVIHIQDTHSNFETQKSIQAAIQFLAEKKGVKTLFMDGTPERNIQSYRSLRSKRYEMKWAFNRLAFAARDAAEEAFNPVLLEFFVSYNAYETEQIELSSYLKILKKTAQTQLKMDLNNVRNQLRFPMLVRYFILKKELPGVDMNQVEKELFRLNARLKQKAARLSKLTRVGRDGSTAASIRTELESILSEVNPESFAIESIGEWSKWAGLTELQQQLQSKPMMAEIATLEEMLLNKLAVRSEEKSFLESYAQLRLLKKLLLMELERSDWERVLRIQPDRFLPEVFRQLFSLRGELLSLSKDRVDTARNYYEDAMQREKYFIEKMQGLQKTQTKEFVAVVIADGFHSEALKTVLKEQEIGYLSVMPSSAS